MVVLVVTMLYQERLRVWALGISPNWIVGVIALLLLCVAISPFVEEKRWPFLAWFVGPSAEEFQGLKSRLNRTEKDLNDAQERIAREPARRAADLATLQSQVTVAQQERDQARQQLATVKSSPVPVPSVALPRRMNWQTVIGLITWLQSQEDLRGNKASILITSSDENSWLRALLGQILVAAFPDVKLLPLIDEKDMDWKLPDNTTAGILVHGQNSLANKFTSVMDGCFVLHKTTSYLDKIESYYKMTDILWVDIGPGIPWKGSPNSSVARGGGPACYDR